MAIILEGHEVEALADSGSQVNTITLGVCECSRLSGSPIGEAGKSSSGPGGNRRPTTASFWICDHEATGERGGRV